MVLTLFGAVHSDPVIRRQINAARRKKGYKHVLIVDRVPLHSFLNKTTAIEREH